MSTEQTVSPASGKSLTMKDIARLSQTSPSTVSRVLTGAAPVAEDKREAVLRAIESVNYRPSLLARSLKTKATQSLGLLINDILNPFYGALARGVEDRASEAGYAVMFCNTNEDPDREKGYLMMLQDKAVDGIILSPTGANRPAMQRLIECGTALVQIDRWIPEMDVTRVTLDNERGGSLAARHLLDAGHRRIGLLTYALRQSTVVQREEGYRRAMAEAGAAAECDVCALSFDLTDTDRRLSALLEKADRPTAVIAANNSIALAALHFFRKRGLRIPDDLAVVVFDDLEVFALMCPALTAVSQPAYAMGRRAADFLLEQLAPRSARVPQTEVFQPTLIVRESSPSRL